MVPAGSTCVPDTSSRALTTHKVGNEARGEIVERATQIGRRHRGRRSAQSGKVGRPGASKLDTSFFAVATSGANVASPSLCPSDLRRSSSVLRSRVKACTTPLLSATLARDLASQPATHLLHQESRVLTARSSVAHRLENAAKVADRQPFPQSAAHHSHELAQGYGPRHHVLHQLGRLLTGVSQELLDFLAAHQLEGMPTQAPRE